MRCGKCGNDVPVGAATCPSCGAPVGAARNGKADDRVLAGLILGIAGIPLCATIAVPLLAILFGKWGRSSSQPHRATAAIVLGIVGLALGLSLLLLVFVIMPAVYVSASVGAGKGSDSAARPSMEAGADFPESMPDYASFNRLPEIHARTNDASAATVVVRISLGYERGRTEVEAELASREAQLVDFLRHYFSSKKADELSPRNEAQMAEDIRMRVNGMLKTKGVKVVKFLRLNVLNF